MGPSSRLDRVEPLAPLCAAHAFQIVSAYRFPEVLAKNRDVDVFGETRDQAVGLGKGCSALEEQAGPARLSAVEERVGNTLKTSLRSSDLADRNVA